MSPAESFNAPELLGNANLAQLYELEEIIQGPWESVIQRERVWREHMLEGMRTYLPLDTETPQFAPDNVEGYFAEARAVNNRHADLIASKQMRSERIIMQGIAATYLGDPETRERLSPLIRAAGDVGLAEFFTENLYGLVGTARSVAQRRFEIARNELLRRRFLGISLRTKSSLTASIKNQSITSAYIQEVESEVRALPPGTAPYPDFFQLSPEQQEIIVRAFGQEWESLCQILHAAAPKLFKQRVSLRTAPLTILPAAELRQALNDNQDVKPEDICYAFLRITQTFQSQIQALRAQAAAAARLRQAREDLGLVGKAVIGIGERVIPRNTYEIYRLLADPDIKAGAQRIAVGQTVALTGDAPTPQDRFDAIIKNHLELIGRTYFEDAPVRNPGGVALIRWDKSDPGPILRDKFAGALRNLTITRLPITERTIAAALGGDREGVTTDNTFHLVFTVQMKSSGKQSETAVLPLLLVMQPHKPHDWIFRRLFKGRGTGRLLTASFRAEAIAIARILEAREVADPLPGGAPGLGKSST